MFRVFRSTRAAGEALSSGTVVTIGNFDGVHLGHQALLARTAELARAARLEGLALTFDPHPVRYFRPERAPALISTEEQKVSYLRASGIEVVVFEPFDERLAKMSPAQFSGSLLVEHLRARHVVVGEAFAFGAGRSGNLDVLRTLGEQLGFSVHPVPAVTASGAPISSTRIRELVCAGETVQAAALLGRPFALEGRVVSGAGRGRKIGVPTANLEPENQLIPARGVYAARVLISGADSAEHTEPERGVMLPAVVNIGIAPTFGGEDRARIEAHLIDFDGDVSWKRLRIDFHERLREERRFDGVDALVSAIRHDIERARALLRATTP